MADVVFTQMGERVKKVQAALREELAAIRTGRASANVLDHVIVEVYGTPTPLNRLASVTVQDARMLTVQPWDKQTMKSIEKAIREADSGLNPRSDGALLRIQLPELTTERRKAMVKMVQKSGEQAKVAVRNVRRETVEQVKKMEKSKEISQDDLRLLEKKIQERTDQCIKEVDEILVQKEADILQI